MRRLILALVAPLMLAACSSGGGTSDSGSGVAGFNSGSTGLFIVATLAADTFSSDTVPSDCDVPPDGVVEQRLTTDNGTISVTVRDTAIVSTSANKGIVFTSYTVAFTPVTPGAPALATRTHGQSIPVILGTAAEASAEAQVILVELDTTKPEFASKNTTGRTFTYNIAVTLRGSRIDTGEAVTVTARTSMELGNFCGGA